MATVLAIGDTHCPSMHEHYPDFLSDIAACWKVDQVVHIGDLVDYSSISFHAKHPCYPSVDVEIAEARKQVQQLRKLFPKMTVLLGNHDSLPERQVSVAGMPPEMLMCRRGFWDTPTWHYLPRFSSHRIDGVIYQHGDRGKQGQQAALKNAKDLFCSVVQGHLHSQCGVYYYQSEEGPVFGAQTGCGIDVNSLAFEYARRYINYPVLGCAVIIDGKHAFSEVMQ